MGSHDEESIPRGGREQGGEPDATGSHGEQLEAGAGTPRETETRVHKRAVENIRSASVNPIY